MEKRLEWDSLGDVGYNKPTNEQKHKNTITSLEKSILKEFFANQGIQISFPLNENIEHLTDNDQSKSRVKKSSQTTKATNEKWREVLDNAKRKYHRDEFESRQVKLDSNQYSFIRKIPDTHSTPKEKTAEKCIQTSTVYPSAENKEIQVNMTKGKSSSLSSAEGDSIVSPSSFEYVAPRQIKYTESSDKENDNPQSSSPKNRKQRIKSARNANEDRHVQSSTDGSGSTSGVNLGVKLLCSLIEAKSLSNKQKKLLAKKIIAKITKKNLNSSNEKTTTTTTSNGLSSASLISTSQPRTTVESSTNSRNSMKTLKSSENLTSTSNQVKINQDNTSIKQNREEKSSSSNSNMLKSSKSENILKSCKSEKNPVDQEKIEKQIKVRSSSLPPPSSSKDISIDRSDLLQNWLGNVTKSEVNYAQRKLAEKLKQSEEGIDVNARGDSAATTRQKPTYPNVMEYLELERINHMNWIENEIKHLENLKKLLNKEEKSKDNSYLPYKPPIITAFPINGNLNYHVYDKVADSSNRSKKRDSTPSNTTDRGVEVKKVVSEVEMRNEKENYSRKVKRTTDEILYEKVDISVNGDFEKGAHHLQITTYTVDEEKKFPKKDYIINGDKNRNRSKLKTPTQQQYENQSTSDSNHHYSELRDVGGDGGLKKQEYKSESYGTSENSREVISREFSPSSISLPIAQNSSSRTITTTHQYDNQVGIGIQTSDSLMRTKPIFGLRLKCGCKNICSCKSGSDRIVCPTIREYQINKCAQTQTKPCAVAYIINFDKKKSGSNEESPQSDDYTLQEYLQKKHPDFSRNVCERQKVINELKCMRQERQKKIENILENASESSFQEKLNQLPPPPTSKLK